MEGLVWERKGIVDLEVASPEEGKREGRRDRGYLKEDEREERGGAWRGQVTL